jgi:hypothetical protein
MKKIIILAAFAFTALLTMGNASGQSVRDTRNVSGFSDIGFGIAGNLYVKTGTEFSVILEGDKKYLAEIVTVVKNGKLVIKTDNYRIFNNERANVYITLPELKGLGVSGSGVALVESNIKTESLDLDVSGSGRIAASEIIAAELNCSISGSGNIEIKGKSEIGKGDVSISGSGNYSGNSAKFNNLKIEISGSGSCTCSVTESLSASVSGSGNVYYYGNPKVNARVSGSGHVRSK